MRFRLAALPEVLPETQIETIDISGEEFRLSGVGTGEPPEQRLEVFPRALRDRIDDPSSIPLVLNQVRVPEQPELVGNP
jgi:hypothetical protein